MERERKSKRKGGNGGVRGRETEREVDYFLTQDDCVQQCVHTRDAIGHQDGTPDFSGPPTDKIINTECDIRVRPSICLSVRPSLWFVHRFVRLLSISQIPSELKSISDSHRAPSLYAFQLL